MPKRIFFLLLFPTILFGQPYRIKVSRTDDFHLNTPVNFRLPTYLKPGNYQLKDAQTQKITLAQVLKDTTLIFIYSQSEKISRDIIFDIKPASAKTFNSVSAIKKPNGISVQTAGKEVLFYHTAVEPPPSDSPVYYARSGFIHPLRSPSGKVLTDDFPAGHAHQHGVMMAWVSTVFRETNPDFWNQQHQRGNVKHVKLISVEEGQIVTRVKLQLEHYTEKYGKILDEEWTITCYPFSKYFLFDIHSLQSNTTNDSLVMKKYHYGGMSFRGSREWNLDDKKHFTNRWSLLTDSGFTLQNANAKRAAFVTVEGQIAGGIAGATVFSFRGNFRYPQPLRVHPEMPYWCYSPTVSEGFAIAPNEKFVSDYRYLLFDGKSDQQLIKQINNDLISPVRVEWLGR